MARIGAGRVFLGAGTKANVSAKSSESRAQ